MNDPYKVLGIPQNATDDEVKSAYRDLARKYHPDNYTGNPLSDLAEDKMKEINEAYDIIMLERRNGKSRTSGAAASQSSTSSQFQDIRRMVNARRVTEAEELLDGVPEYKRDAEWFFLKGSVQYTRGWLEEAYENFKRAVKMNPENAEYRAALNQLEWQRRTGRPTGGGYHTRPNVAGCGSCDICTSLLCADCCCECMGGDFIACC